jgi:hypothetical protein
MGFVFLKGFQSALCPDSEISMPLVRKAFGHVHWVHYPLDKTDGKITSSRLLPIC